MHDDDARPAAQRVDDPAVRVGVVADVVEREVGAARRARLAAADDLDVDVLAVARGGAARCSPRCPTAPAASVCSRRPSREQALDAAIPRHLGRQLAAGAAVGARLVAVLAQVSGGARELGGVGRGRRGRWRGRSRPRAARRRRSSSAPASRTGTPRTAPSRSPRPPARSRRRGSARTARRARPRRPGR